MYLVTPYPERRRTRSTSRSRASRSSGSSGRRTRRQAIGRACCDVVNRGAAYADGKIFYNLLDGHTVAVDAATGSQLWRTKMGDLDSRRDDHDGADRREGQSASSARAAARWACAAGSPRIDVGDGQGSLARATTSAPDSDVKVGPRFKPFYAQDRGKNLGVNELAGRHVEDRAAARCGVGSPTTRSSISSITARAIPARGTQISARATTSGRARSSRATPTPASWCGRSRSTPHDMWDYDAVNENILVDLPIRRHDAEGARALRPQRLRVHDRSRDRRGAPRASRSCR